MMIFSVGFLVVSYFTASAVSAEFVGQDVVLSCSLVEEGGGFGSMGASSGHFSRTPATLVLKDLPVSADTSPETLTPYIPPANPDPDNIIIEAKVTSPEIPEADSLLHADCEEQEVACEISRYYPRGLEVDAGVAYFIGSVVLEGGGISLTLVLRTLPPIGEGDESAAAPLMQSKLELPLTPSGTLLSEVAFVVFSRSQSLTTPLGGDTLLDCGFKQQEPFPAHEMWLEWRLQHRGSGSKVLEMKAVEPEEQPIVLVERNGSSVDLALAVEEGNVSLTVRKVTVPDEGTYICTVGAGFYQAQQVMQLQVIQPPQVSLSVDELIFKDGLPRRVSCHCERYYPLDVEVEWLYLLPSKTEPISLTQNASLTSHRQFSDKTLSLTSHVTLHPAALPAGTIITCLVSHRSLDTPLTLSLTVLAPETEERSYWMIVGMLAATLLSFYFLLK